MKIGKQTIRSTAISTADAKSVTIRGKDLASELIGKVTLTELFGLMVLGNTPTPGQTAILDATLVAISEHGLVPSVQASRMTLAAAPEALQGAVAAGILGCGSVILGSVETAGRMLLDISATAEREKVDAKTAARNTAAAIRQARKPLPGFGHPQHSDGDPRAKRLLELARERNDSHHNVELLEYLTQIVPEIFNRPLPLNVSGAIAGVLLDAGFPVTVLKGIPILARTAGLIAHINEEQTRPIGFVLAAEAAQAIEYDGPPAKN